MSILGDRSAPELGVYPRRDQPVIVRPEPDYRHHRKDDPDLKHYRGTLTLSNYESNQRTVIFKMKTNVPLKKITLSPNYGRLKPAQRKEVQIIISLNLNEDGN